MIVLVPTRGRPQNAARLIKAWEETDANANLLFCVDDDDPVIEQYLRLDADFLVGESKRLGPWLNAVAPQLTGADVLGFMGDDHVPRTRNWDQRIVYTLTHRPGIAYGNDLFQGQNLPTAVFISSSIVEVLGYFCPPGLNHWYLDDGWREWGAGAGCLTYLPEVIIEHMHPGLGKAEVDASYEATSKLGNADIDRWRVYLANELQPDLVKIRKVTEQTWK